VPPRSVSQSREIKDLFRATIKEKVARDKAALRQRVDDEVPSWLAWAVKPLENLKDSHKRLENASQGQDGEDRVAIGLWLWLSKQWVVAHDVVLELEPDEFAQYDHVLIGPAGIYIVETKAWDSAYLGTKDRWRRKEGNRWVSCKSPTEQNQRHVRLFRKWLDQALPGRLPPNPDSWLLPVVLLLRAEWVKTEDCSMPVYQSPLELILDIKKRSREPVLEPSHINAVAAALADARPYGSRDRGNAPEPRGWGDSPRSAATAAPSRGPLVLSERPMTDRGTPARRVIGVAEPTFPEDEK